MLYVEFHLIKMSCDILRMVSFFLDVEVCAADCAAMISSMMAFHWGRIIVVEFFIVYTSFNFEANKNKKLLVSC